MNEQREQQWRDEWSRRGTARKHCQCWQCRTQCRCGECKRRHEQQQQQAQRAIKQR